MTLALSYLDFLSSRLETGEPFAVLGGKVYELSITRDASPRNRLICLGHTIEFQEGDSLSELEKGFFETNKQHIERYGANFLFERQQETQRLLAHVNSLENRVGGEFYPFEKFVLENAGKY